MDAPILLLAGWSSIIGQGFPTPSPSIICLLPASFTIRGPKKIRKFFLNNRQKGTRYPSSLSLHTYVLRSIGASVNKYRHHNAYSTKQPKRIRLRASYLGKESTASIHIYYIIYNEVNTHPTILGITDLNYFSHKRKRLFLSLCTSSTPNTTTRTETKNRKGKDEKDTNQIQKF